MATTTIDRTDTSYDLITHVPSGDVFAAQFASTWTEDGSECTGSTIVALSGPVCDADIPGEVKGILSPEQVEFVSDTLGNDSESPDAADWANEQEWSVLGSSV